tara:strand:+ start:110 stop:484 length:375 start_codon:yes stop_codon:yes gene_type:complete
MKQKKYLRFRSKIYRIISCFFLINNTFLISTVFADYHNSQIGSENFKEVFLKGDIKYEYHDSYTNQIELFFGMGNSLNASEKKFFKDLALPFSSRDIRQLYDIKLKQMSLKENYDSDIFYKGKL